MIKKNIYNAICPFNFEKRLIKDLANCKTILELGCGENSPLLRFGIAQKSNVTAVDIWKPYIDYHKKENYYKNQFVANCLELDFENNSFDAVVCLDLLEHLDKQEVLKTNFLHKIFKWTSKKIIIFTPNGYINNLPNDNNVYQGHKSGWITSELQQFRFKVNGMNGFKITRIEKGEPRIKYGGKYIAELSNNISYFIPKLAFSLYAIKYKTSKKEDKNEDT